MSNKANVKAFKLDIKKVAEKLDVSIGIIVTKIALEAWTKLTDRTPVDTGRAKASWTIKESSPSSVVPEPGDYFDPELPAKNYQGKKSVFVTTALDYVSFLNDGTSDQAPAGFVEIVLAEIEVELEHIIDSLP
jgi:hypothetical protein